MKVMGFFSGGTLHQLSSSSPESDEIQGLKPGFLNSSFLFHESWTDVSRMKHVLWGLGH